MDQLDRLRAWYTAQCDGDWEHSYGVKLDTLDNPGWTLEVDLADTDLHDKTYVTVQRGNPETDESWLHCSVSGHKFRASGGAPDLSEVIETFLDWAGV